jgi:hypothetical protein
MTEAVTEVSKTPIRPARLDIVDMPRDPQKCLGGIRQAICATFNYCRRHPTKMAILKSVVKYTYSRITQWEREVEAENERVAAITKKAEAAKAEAEEAAAVLAEAATTPNTPQTDGDA